MIDDDVEDIYTTQRAFSTLAGEIDFRAFTNAAGFFEELEGAPAPDLILLDLNMHEPSGLEVLGRLRAAPDWRFIPVVILTTSEEIEDAKRALLAGANAVVTKPSSLRDMGMLALAIHNFWNAPSLMVPPVRLVSAE